MPGRSGLRSSPDRTDPSPGRRPHRSSLVRRRPPSLPRPRRRDQKARRAPQMATPNCTHRLTTVVGSATEEYGAFNISLINDLPLFIDPFLLFNSSNEQYQKLHSEIIRYMLFLRDRSAAVNLSARLLGSWFVFT